MKPKSKRKRRKDRRKMAKGHTTQTIRGQKNRRIEEE